ncbi:hypothetical protein EDD16DRAFT_1524388 [Pisolithus croceorrhizus]|nr:hypothetical protein EDD16DRAFT_1524388 [Pisolithus croceorrhizus]KAI6158822.1 hypothetical protein EDD17DRAFT_1511858 [Pisolithus thermaeus]
MFVKNSLALQDTVNCILTIFEMLIINLGGLDEAEKLEQWRNAVRDIQWELLIRVLLLQESVRSIANRTDNIPHMLIGMDKYVHWMENIGMPGIPFPDWRQALFPPIESITDHPWLLTIKWQYDVGLQVQPLASTTEAVGSTSSAMPTGPPLTLSLSMVPHMAPKGSAGHIPMQSTPLGKGKAQATSEGKVAMVEEIVIPCEDDNRDKSEDIEEDIDMDDIEPNASVVIMNDPKGQESHDELDQMIGHIDEIEQQIVQDNSMQTPQADTGTTMTTSHVVELQDENVRSPHSKSETREVTPTCREPPAIDQGVELLATESSDNGGQGGQGEEANIVEGTAVAGEAQPIITEEGGIGGEHHQMTEENSGECPTEAEGGTTILVSKGKVAEVSGVNTEEELVSTGGKFPEEH